MSRVNVHGLSRDQLSEEVKRVVRQQSGFGCVVCGCALYEYEHFEPEFKDAKEHRAEGMTLLCPTCHRQKGTFLSRARIREAIENPQARRAGYSFGPFDAGADPQVCLGTIRGRRVKSLIRIDGEVVLGITPPEVPNGPARLNAMFKDQGGNPTLEIVNNEWRVQAANWDARVEGCRIVIRRGPRDLALALRSDPGKSMSVERLRMFHRGTEIDIREGAPVKVRLRNGFTLVSSDWECEGCIAVVDVHGDHLTIGLCCESLVIGNMSVGPGIPPTRSIGSNELCPCDSGLTFGACHGELSSRPA